MISPDDPREWIVTNGIGGYACGTPTGLLSRRYHGLLVAALHPPLGRTLLLSKFEETVILDGAEFPLSVNRWAGGALEPRGDLNLESFELQDGLPCWTYRIKDQLLEKRLWMAHGGNTVHVSFALKGSTRPMGLRVRILVNYRDHNGVTKGDGWRMGLELIEDGLKVVAYDGAVAFSITAAGANFELRHDWYLGFDLARERERGLEDREDHLCCGEALATLMPGEALCFRAGPGGDEPWTLDQALTRQRSLISGPGNEPPWIRALQIAADQFLVTRDIPDQGKVPSIIAGYPWFSDWSRDCLISLGGLCLARGRHDLAKATLMAFAAFVDEGMLPNYFPESGLGAEYNSVDASLWFVLAMRDYEAASSDLELGRELYPLLAGITEAFALGTRYHIHADTKDGLVFAGQAGLQLTWMDAKVGADVITPRIGKPVEINALWVSALDYQVKLGLRLGKDMAAAKSRAAKARLSFRRFFDAKLGFCKDLLDGPQGDDPTLRPNQIFAVSHAENLLSQDQQKAVVDACAARLLTPYGIRTLDPKDASYQGRYQGSVRERDGAYHQGTAWPWLMGPFIQAHLKVYNDAAACRRFLGPLAEFVVGQGLGTLPEVFDGSDPQRPGGCFSQAWSVAEILRVWELLKDRS